MCCEVRIIFPQQMKLPELKSVADILNEGRPLSNEVHTVPSVGGIHPDLFPCFPTSHLPSPSLFLHLPQQREVTAHVVRMQELTGGRKRTQRMYQQARANEMAMRRCSLLATQLAH